MGSYVPPGWDEFKMTRPSAESSFRSPTMSINGRIQTFPGREVTELVSAQTRDFITSSIAGDQPFFAYYSLTAPHFARGDHRVDYPNEPVDTTWVPAAVPAYRAPATSCGSFDQRGRRPRQAALGPQPSLA